MSERVLTNEWVVDEHARRQMHAAAWQHLRETEVQVLLQSVREHLPPGPWRIRLREENHNTGFQRDLNRPDDWVPIHEDDRLSRYGIGTRLRVVVRVWFPSGTSSPPTPARPG